VLEQSPSLLHVVPHEAVVPEHRAAPHAAGDAVAGSSVQTPSAVAPSDFAQTSHVPPHTALQQNESEHDPDAHWRLRVQPPACSNCGTHAPALQYESGAQSVSVAQDDGHVLDVPEHA
jgi:hypothetical protein